MILNAEPAAKYAIIREMTERDNNILNLSWLCKLAGVSRSGYYKWLNANDNRAENVRNDEKDFDLILKAYQHRGYDMIRTPNN